MLKTIYKSLKIYYITKENFMEITNVSVMPLKNGKFDCLAICQFTIDNAFIITGIKLYQKSNKFYIVFPKNIHNKKSMKYCHPVSDAIYQKVLDAILDAYMTQKESGLNDPTNMVAEDKFYKSTFGETAFEGFGKELEKVEEMKTAARIIAPNVAEQCKQLSDALKEYEDKKEFNQKMAEEAYKAFEEKQNEAWHKFAEKANEAWRVANENAEELVNADVKKEEA